MTKRKSFSPEFKREAVGLLDSSQKPPADLARDLGVRRNQLYKWKEQLGKRGARAFAGSGKRPTDEESQEGQVFTLALWSHF